MKITPESITVKSIHALKSLNNELELGTDLKFEQPIVDKNEKVLIKEHIPVKEKVIQQLEEMEGSYKPVFTIKITKDILLKIRNFLTKEIVDLLKRPENDFINSLFEDSNQKYKAYILHSLNSAKLIPALYNFHVIKRDFFNHIAALGLLSLGISIQHSSHIKLIHRYAFLAGLVCDLIYSGSDAWKQPVTDYETQKKRAHKASDFAAHLEMAGEIIVAIQRYPVKSGEPVTNQEIKFDDDLLFGNDTESENETPTDSKTAQDEVATGMLIEIIKLAKFIQTTTQTIDKESHFAEELVYIIAYNSSKGYFHNDLINSIIKIFKDFKENALNLIEIGHLEAKCIHGDQALAYAKPKPTQVLCLAKDFDCPNVITGWDINIISATKTYGWLGAVVDTGSYPKCLLEKDLPKKDI